MSHLETALALKVSEIEAQNKSPGRQPVTRHLEAPPPPRNRGSANGKRGYQQVANIGWNLPQLKQTHIWDPERPHINIVSYIV